MPGRSLLRAIAVSMLPVSRSRAAAAFKARTSREASSADACDAVLSVLAACGCPDSERPQLARQAEQSAHLALERAAALDITAIALDDERYPALLACAPDPPPVLWIRGSPAVLRRPAVAVVGSRAATPYALEVGARLGAELAGRGLVVVSGLARGVDSAAHRGCLGAGGATAAVLGSGVDRIYPAEHRSLAVNICKDGVLVSELGPGAAPRKEHFPLRNRIISGISLAVVVVEASENSGSLITARCALEQGRDVMAVPGNVLSGRNRGSHGLLKDGAKVVESADDILDGLGWRPADLAPLAGARSLDTDAVLRRMEAGESYLLDELVALTGLAGPALLTRLMEFQLAGVVTEAAGGRFARASHNI